MWRFVDRPVGFECTACQTTIMVEREEIRWWSYCPYCGEEFEGEEERETDWENYYREAEEEEQWLRDHPD